MKNDDVWLWEPFRKKARVHTGTKINFLSRIWCLKNVNFVKNETLKLWMRLWKCGFWYFQNVNFWINCSLLPLCVSRVVKMLILRSQCTAPSEFFGEDALPSMTIRSAFSDDITTVKVENGHPKKFVRISRIFWFFCNCFYWQNIPREMIWPNTLMRFSRLGKRDEDETQTMLPHCR